MSNKLGGLLDKQLTFDSFGLDDRILKALSRQQLEHPTLIQSSAIPLALQGKDILARARTGSGKTIAYSVPILQRLIDLKESKKDWERGVKALVLVPTRELCEQIKDHFIALSQYCSDIAILAIAGDVSLKEQLPRLKEGPDVLIGTPSRIAAHLVAKNFKLDKLKMLVVDEADLILSFGYSEDIHKIVNFLPKICQSFLMSATLGEDVETLRKLVLHTPAVLKLEETEQKERNLVEYAIACSQEDKYLIIYALIRLKVIPGKALFFVNSIDGCYKLKLFMERFSINAAVLNSELPHNSRYHILQQFNKGIFDYLIATDETFIKEEDESDDEDSIQNEKEESVDQEEESKVSEDEDKEEGEGGEEEDEEEDAQEFEKKILDAQDFDMEEMNEGEEDELENKLLEDNEDEDEDDEEERKKAEAEMGDDDDDNEVFEKISKKAKKEEKKGKKKNEEVKLISGKKSKYMDKEYGVSRGIDFKGVETVVNFDFPKSKKSYVHRIGRTARGGAQGTALSLVALDDEPMLKKIEEKRSEEGKSITPYKFNMKVIEGFRYRVEDILSSITKSSVKQARLQEIKAELLNSEKLKTHFEENPRELSLLKHDKILQNSRIQKHLKFLPNYLVPAPLQQAINHSKTQRLVASITGKRQREDPLQNLALPDDDLMTRSRKPLRKFKKKKQKKKIGRSTVVP